MKGWVDEWTDGGIGRLDEWTGCRPDYSRMPQDTACYSRMLQDTFKDARMFNRNLT